MLSLGSVSWAGRSEPGWRKERVLSGGPFIAPIFLLALLVVAVGCGEDAVPTTTVDDVEVLHSHGAEFCADRPNHPHCRDDEDDDDSGDDGDAPEEDGYFVTILGDLDSSSDAVRGVNKQCRVVGRAGDEPFVWDPDLGMRSFLDGGPQGGAMGVNGHGTIVGFAFADGLAHGFVWDDGNETRIEPLDTYEDLDATSASGVNDGGVIIGGSWVTDPDVHTGRSFVLEPGSEDPFVLEPLDAAHDGELRSVALGINNDGLVIGSSSERWWDDEDERRRSEVTRVVWAPAAEGWKEPTPIEPQAFLYGVNNDGDLVGSTGSVGLLWLNDQPLELKAPPGHESASARALTDRNDGVIRVVGSSIRKQGQRSIEHAVLWTVTVAGEVEVEDLGTPEDYHTARATAVTLRDGEIVVGGRSEHRRGGRAAVLWTSAQDACDG